MMQGDYFLSGHTPVSPVLISEMFLQESSYSDQYIVSSIQVKTSSEMYKFLREMSVPKLSALILRLMFYLARFLGILCFRIKSTTDDQVTMEESGPWWKWSITIIRFGCLSTSTWTYIGWINLRNDLIQEFLHFIRVFLNIACPLSILRLHFFYGKECTQLVNRFVEVFRRVRSLCKRKQIGFGATHELVLLTIFLVCLTHEEVFLLHIFRLRYTGHRQYICVADAYITLGNKLTIYIAFVGYLALGLLYADMNHYVRTKLRSQLESLEEQPTPRKLRRARKNLDKCLTLYKDIQILTSMFQRIYDLPLLLGLGRSCIDVAVVSYSTFINLDVTWPWLCIKISNEVVSMLLLTLSVQRAMVQFGVIRSLKLDNCYLSENKEWHKTLDVFFNHLNLYEFQVRPLGLFNVSNEFVVVFLSAVITYMTVVIQYGMQLEALTLTNV